MTSVDPNTGTASAYGVTVDSSGNVSIDGLVDNVISALDAKAPQAVKDLVNAAVNTALTFEATEAGIEAAAAAVTTDAATLAAVSAAAPVAAVVLAVPALLLAIDPASSGPGCCGQVYPGEPAAQAQRFGACDPAQYDWNGPNGPGAQAAGGSAQWNGSAWVNGAPPPTWVPSTPWEVWIGAYMLGAFRAMNDCSHMLRPAGYVALLAQAVGAWNAGHASSSTAKVSRFVNLTLPSGTFHGQPQPPQTGQPVSWTDPIAVALNFSSMVLDSSGQPTGQWYASHPFAVASVTVNTGPVLSLSGVQPIKIEPCPPGHVYQGGRCVAVQPTSTAMHPAAKVAVGLVATAAAAAGGVGVYALATGQRYGDAWRRLGRALTGGGRLLAR